MTAPKDNDLTAVGEQNTKLGDVPSVASKDINPNSSDHYDVSIELDQRGDPDRVHVTSISPRARK